MTTSTATGQPGAERSVTSTPAISVEGVHKQFAAGAREALAGVDLSIPDGEFFSILGPSGCGKTTLLRILAGFEQPSAGKVLLHGTDVTATPPNRRDVNLVFQNYALFPQLTVVGNIAFGLKRKKVPSAEVEARVREMVNLVELEGREDAKPKQLSGGQQQRVALARALVNRPRALLLDEPLAALDLKLRQAMQEELKRIQREVGITFVYVTHDQGEALALSDRVAVMSDGLLRQVGTPAELYERPADAFVARFIGSSTLLEGTITGTGDRRRLRLANGGSIPVGTGAADALPEGTAAGLAIRPERIRLTATAAGEAMADAQVDAAGRAMLEGTVEEVDFLGPTHNYRVRVGDGSLIRATTPNEGLATPAHPRGTPVVLSWSLDAVAVVPL